MNSPCRRIQWPLFLLAAGVSTTLVAAEPRADFVTGEVLRRTLADPIGVSWSGRTFRDALESISRNTRVAVVLDRRVDPNRNVEWSAPALPVGKLLDELAALHDCGVVWIGPTALVAAKANVGGIVQALTDRQAEAAKLPDDLRLAAIARRPMAWDDFAEPSVVLESLAGEAKLRWTNLGAVPHDLLYHASMPATSLVERLTLVTAMFGQTYRIDGAARTITLVPLPAGTANSPVTPKPPAVVRPPVANAKPAALGTQVHTLKVDNVPLSTLVRVLRDKNGLKIRFDDEAIKQAGLTTEKLTSVDVKQVSLEALLEHAAAPLGLTAKLIGDTVVIGPK